MSKQNIFFPIFLTILLSLFVNQLAAQTYSLSGKVIDGETQQPMADVDVRLIGGPPSIMRNTKTLDDGSFSFDNLYAVSYNLYFSHLGYASHNMEVEITEEGNSPNIEVSIFRQELTEEEESKLPKSYIDYGYHSGFAVNFYSPSSIGTSAAYKSSWNMEWLYSFKKRLTNFDQFGLEFGYKLFWHTLEEDSVITPEVYQKERYGGSYITAYLYNRIVVSGSSNPEFPGLFLDFGVGYELPITFRYNYWVNSNQRTIIRRIHNYQEFRAMARLGFGVLAIKASYRFLDVLEEPYIQPPKIKFGIELQMPGG